MRTGSRLAVGVIAAAFCALVVPFSSSGQSAGPLDGTWSLNRTLSELPREMGFSVNWIPAPGSSDQNSGSGGGRGGRRGSGGGSAGAFPIQRESYDDARRLQFLTAEARNPPSRLTIVDLAAAVTITTDAGQSRVLHPTGRQESIEVQGVPLLVTTKRESDRLVVVYAVEEGREIRYTYAHPPNSPQLVVDVQFLEHGSGDKAKRIYEPGAAIEPVAARPATPPAAPAAPTGSSARSQGASGQKAPDSFDQRPGAELRGLKNIGILVEDLGPQAVACGLNHDALETALSKRLSAGGFSVRANSDEDTYLYINIITTTLPNGTCVSRYDAFLYTHATANLSYREGSVLVQASLMHRGGIGTSAPTGHAAAVGRGLEAYVDVFVQQIQAANK